MLLTDEALFLQQAIMNICLSSVTFFLLYRTLLCLPLQKETRGHDLIMMGIAMLRCVFDV